MCNVLCCQITLLIFLCLILGFLLAIFIAGEFNIKGLPDLWDKFIGLFKSSPTNVTKKP